MPRRRHTPDQIFRELAEGHRLLAGGAELDEVCRQLEIAAADAWIMGEDLHPTGRSSSLGSAKPRASTSGISTNTPANTALQRARGYRKEPGDTDNEMEWERSRL